MNRLIVGGLVAGGLMVGAASLVIGAGIAHADPASYGGLSAFQRDMDANGFFNENGNAAQLAVGRSVCNNIANGERPLMVAVDLESGSGLDGYHAGKFVAISVKDLCPQFIPQVLADANSPAAYDAPLQNSDQVVTTVGYAGKRHHKDD
jgi:hypothetical protein